MQLSVLDELSGIILTDLTGQLGVHVERVFFYGDYSTQGAHLRSLQCHTLDDTRTKIISDCAVLFLTN